MGTYTPSPVNADEIGGIPVVFTSIADGYVITYESGQLILKAGGGGAVTSVSNSDGTLTVSPTTGAVVASINLANANTWTTTQTFEPSTSISAIQLLGEQTTSATAMVNVIFTFADASGLAAGTYPFIQAPRDTSLYIGVNAGKSMTPSASIPSLSVGIGYDALYSATSITYNTAVGGEEMYSITTGSDNTAIGTSAMYGGTQAANNVAIGSSALYSNTTGWYNIAIGYQSLVNFNGTGLASTYHIGIGYDSGKAYTGTETNNILIGSVTSTSDIANGIAGESNVIRIGNSASANMYIGGPVASSGSTEVNSVTLNLLGAYWNGSASVPYGFQIVSDITATTPTATLEFALNDNGTITNLWGIDSTGQTTVSNGITGTGSTGTLTAGTGILGTANTWSAVQTFTNSDIALLGSSTGYTTFTSANASATDYVLTIPANTGTLAELNLAQTWTALQTFGNNISIGGAALNVSSLVSGQMLQYNGTNWVNVTVSTSSTVSEVANASDTELTATTATTIATFTPTAQGNFMVMVYFRVITASTVVTVELTWDDGTGSQTYYWLNGATESVDSYTLPVQYINATTGAAIDVIVTAGTANQVYASATIVEIT